MAFPERIVCLTAEVPEILFRLGALDKVVGSSAYTTRPQEALQIPKVSGEILQLGPILVDSLKELSELFQQVAAEKWEAVHHG